MTHSDCAKCSQKVLRSSDKLYCIKCYKYFHSHCCDIKTKEEFELIKTNYKCMDCISARRNSIISNKDSLMPKSSNSLIEVPSNVPTAGSTMAEKNADAGLENESSTDSLAASHYNDASHDVTILSTTEEPSSELLLSDAPAISLDMIFAELLALRKSHKILENLVISLTAEVKTLKSDKAVPSNKAPSESSPKKKKPKAAKPTNGAPNVITQPLQVSSQDSVSFAATVRGDNSSDLEVREVITANPWQTVGRVNIAPTANVPKKQKPPLCIGEGEITSDLQVLDRKKWLHLSSFKNTVSADNIIEFVSKNFNISRTHISCYPLVKKEVDINDLKFINFKLGVSACSVHKIFNSTIWPANVKVRHFTFLEKEAVELKV